MDKRLKIPLDEVKGSDPNLDTMDRNTRVRADNYQFPYLRCVDSTISVIQFASITKDIRLSVLSYDVSARNLTQAFVNINEDPEGIANSLYQYLGFTDEELTIEQFKNGLKNAILAYKDGPIA